MASSYTQPTWQEISGIAAAGWFQPTDRRPARAIASAPSPEVIAQDRAVRHAGYVCLAVFGMLFADVVTSAGARDAVVSWATMGMAGSR
jgi:hypothetical protein